MAGQGNKNLKRNIRPEAPSLLQRVDVLSSKKGSKDSVSLVNGTVRLLYWESILADTVSASLIFTDAGNTMSTQKTGQGHGKRKKKVSAVEGLPILGGEQVDLKFTDNKGNSGLPLTSNPSGGSEDQGLNMYAAHLVMASV